MKYKILSLLEEGGFISGEKIAKELGVSRTAVWKNIKLLQKEGYKIETSTRKGYRLLTETFPYNEFEIAKNLKTNLIGKALVFMDEIDSTNEEIKRLCADNPQNGLCVAANKQTGGKGRLGRSWSSPGDENIYFSLCLIPNVSLAAAPQITLMEGLAVCTALNESLGIGAKIKWPNDIIVNGRKICGILTEVSAEIDIIKYIVCGVGINVNTVSFPDAIKDIATSLRLETGKVCNRALLLSTVLEKSEYYYGIFSKHGNLSGIIDEYRKNCINLGKKCTAIYKGETITGIVCDVDENGNLVIEKENKERMNIFSGEVTLCRPDGISLYSRCVK